MAAVSVVRAPLSDVRISHFQDKELQALQTKAMVEETLANESTKAVPKNLLVRRCQLRYVHMLL